MSTYKNLIGKDINYLTTDPDNVQAEGQIWYNSTSGEFKDMIISQAWSSGGIVNNARRGGAASGTLTAGLAFGGRIPPGTNVADTEEYNGSGWTTGGNLGTARYNLASATNAPQTASLAFGSATSPDTTTEEYNGSSWTAGGALNAGRGFLGGAGIQTAALGFGGYTGGNVNNVEEYDGSSWTAANVFPSSTRQMGGNGLQTAALSTGGTTTGPSISTTVEYDGTNWTSGGAYPQAIIDVRLAGIQTDTLAFGGSPPPSKTTLTTNYDGTSWTVNPASMATPRTAHFGAGTSSDAFAASGLTGGPPPSSTPFSEEYNRSLNVITAGAWSAGGTIPYSSPQKNGSGIQTAAFAVGGETPPGAMVNTSVKYDGTSWTATNNINSARGDVMAAGTLTAGLIMGGYQNVPDPNFLFEETEEFNGTSWSEVNDMPTGAYSGSGTGTQTAAFVNNMYIGSPGERTNVTYEYDGTNWSNGGNTAETTNSRSSVGTLTAGLTVGGRPAPSSYIDKTELYDGTSWTSGVDMISEFQAGGQSSKGTQSDCIIFGSPRTPANTDTYKTDGTTWFTQPSMATYQNNGTGTSTAALAFGNGTTSVEFNGETSALNIKTITTS